MASSNTNFQKVQTFNRAFDMAPLEPPIYSSTYVNTYGHTHYNSFIHIIPESVMNAKLMKLRLSLINEEINELHCAIADNDIIETRDALSDILYVVYGFSDVLGINIDNYFNDYFLLKLDDLDKINTLDTLVNTEFININIKNLTSRDILKSIYANTNINTNINTNANINPKINKQGLSLQISNFNKVCVLMECNPEQYSDCSNTSNKQTNLQIIHTYITNNYKELEAYCNICKIECDEQSTYTNPNNNPNNKILFNNIANYINNILLWVYTYTFILGYNADSDFAIVHNSNMSKLCDTEDDAINTVNDYTIKYKEGKSPYDSPYYYELPQLHKWIVKNKSTGKALKNIKYHKVCFTL